jgi:hypothetical protein
MERRGAWSYTSTADYAFTARRPPAAALLAASVRVGITASGVAQ